MPVKTFGVIRRLLEPSKRAPQNSFRTPTAPECAGRSVAPWKRRNVRTRVRFHVPQTPVPLPEREAELGQTQKFRRRGKARYRHVISRAGQCGDHFVEKLEHIRYSKTGRWRGTAISGFDLHTSHKRARRREDLPFVSARSRVYVERSERRSPLN